MACYAYTTDSAFENIKFDYFIVYSYVCNTLKCENAAICEKVAKCEQNSTLNVNKIQR